MPSPRNKLHLPIAKAQRTPSHFSARRRQRVLVRVQCVSVRVPPSLTVFLRGGEGQTLGPAAEQLHSALPRWPLAQAWTHLFNMQSLLGQVHHVTRKKEINY